MEKLFHLCNRRRILDTLHGLRMENTDQTQALTSIADSLLGIRSDMRAISVSLDCLNNKANAWARLYEMGNAAEVWAEKELEE